MKRETKVHYKLYKAGKLWLVASLTSLSLGLISQSTLAKSPANTSSLNSKTTKTTNSKNPTYNSSNSSFSKTSTGHSSFSYSSNKKTSLPAKNSSTSASLQETSSKTKNTASISSSDLTSSSKASSDKTNSKTSSKTSKTANLSSKSSSSSSFQGSSKASSNTSSSSLASSTTDSSRQNQTASNKKAPSKTSQNSTSKSTSQASSISNNSFSAPTKKSNQKDNTTPENGWYTDANGNKYYYNNGKPYQGKLFNVDGKYYYAQTNGVIQNANYSDNIHTLQNRGSFYGRGLEEKYSANPFYNGNLYALFEHTDQTNTNEFSPSDLQIFRSLDNGNTWSLQGTINRNTNGYNSILQPDLYELPENIGNLKKGTFLIAANQAKVDSNNNLIGDSIAMNLFASSDHGKTWTSTSQIAHSNPKTNDDNRIWEPDLIDINGQLVTYFSDERDSNYSQKIAHVTSKDALNWSQPVNDVVGSDYSAKPGMPQVAKMANGKYIMTYEHNGGNQINYKISDDGLNWNPTVDGTYLCKGGSGYVTVLPTGTIIAGSYHYPTVFVNHNNGQGNWLQFDVGMPAAYSRSLTALSNNQFLIVNGGDMNTGLQDNTGTTLVVSLDGFKKDLSTKNTYYYQNGSQKVNYLLDKRLSDGHMFYFGADGKQLFNQWFTVNGKRYFADANGYVKYHALYYSPDGKIFYFNPDGSWRTTEGWLYYQGKFYYISKNGLLFKNMILDNTQNGGHKFYFGSDGALAFNQTIQFQGKTYVIDFLGHVKEK